MVKLKLTYFAIESSIAIRAYTLVCAYLVLTRRTILTRIVASTTFILVCKKELNFKHSYK